ncbi:GspH/FimT family pseudopilin [Microbulbifer variabilis]|uniref:Type II secretion system protein H n=1 Tax=Microbulbifer variabilis TaxID=266805 RepID=A0ABY4VCR2_9GAMM|nr:GspH/FimT family pseudopilin [Microbulbifer variabilis]USD22090.1 GspH/FimT family pseudopilin [Microbulbifer variabilis]
MHRKRFISTHGKKRTQSGFTLIELLVAMTVFAIVVSVAIPSFTDMINNYRSSALADDFINALHYSRSEAVKRGTNVSICASSNGSSCAGENKWSDGWIVFVDGALTEKAIDPVVDSVLRSWDFKGEEAVIGVTQNAATKFVRFTGMGTLGRFVQTNISVKTSGCTGDSANNIVLANSGVISISKTSCE